MSPYIVHVPYGDAAVGRWQVEGVIDDEIRRMAGGDSGREEDIKRYVRSYPVVYVVHGDGTNRHSNRPEYVVYVGESTDIVRRTMQHLHADAKKRSDWATLVEQSRVHPADVRQYIIGDRFFNKSLTLDVENRMMQYMSSCDRVKRINNRRGNPQGEYYTSAMFDAIFHDIWASLHQQDPMLFPAEEFIRDSALFKASPFHRLSQEQQDAEQEIMETLREVQHSMGDNSTLIMVEGAAGTGKTVLLSNLFCQMLNEAEENADENDDDPAQSPSMERLSTYLLVNHGEQLRVYNQIAMKLGLQQEPYQIVMKPSTFIKRHSKKDPENSDKPVCREETVDDGWTKRGRKKTKRVKHYVPDDKKVDVVLVDEAHLLMTQGNQGYTGTNMLADLLRRAKVVIAVFDPSQILQTSQRWKQEDMEKLFPADRAEGKGATRSFLLEDVPVDSRRVVLRHQFRVAADKATTDWLEKLIHEGTITDLQPDKGLRAPQSRDDDMPEWLREPYDIKVFDSPLELMSAIQEKAKEPAGGVNGKGLSRVLATYDWEYSGAGGNKDEGDGLWRVQLYRSDDVWKKGKPESLQDVDVDAGTHQPLVFDFPWNYQLEDTPEEKALGRIAEQAWAEKPHTIGEIGSTYTIQGFDLNYAGVIIGPSVSFDEESNRIVFNPGESASRRAVNERRDLFPDAEGSILEEQTKRIAVENLRNELNVLLTRGVHGLYVFAVDPKLQAALKNHVPREKGHERDQ